MWTTPICATEAATQAVKHVDTVGMNARTAGRELHTFAEGFATSRRSKLTSEVSYLDGQLTYRGRGGSSRPDIVEGDLLNPEAIFDFKFGEQGITSSWESTLRGNLPTGSQGVSLTEIRPYTGEYQRITGAGATYNLYDDIFGSSESYAGGGFVLYPNKPNNNMMQTVYRK